MEERKKRRVPFQKDVIINGAVIAYALDISEIGMYLHATCDFVKDAVLDLSFDMEGRHMSVKAVIQHMEPEIGIGVKFLNLQSVPENLALIKGFIRTKSEGRAETAIKKVLLIDGNSQTRTVNKNLLLHEDFEVIEASNGLQAFKAIQQSLPDVIIMDPYIEKVDGFKLLQLMKINPSLSLIPVVIVSPKISPEDVDKAITLGAKDYLLKGTTTPAKLIETVKRLLSSEKGPAS